MEWYEFSKAFDIQLVFYIVFTHEGQIHPFILCYENTKLYRDRGDLAMRSYKLCARQQFNS